jgi:hypothetical protein
MGGVQKKLTENGLEILCATANEVLPNSNIG